MNSPLRWVATALLLLTTSCAFHSSATHWNGLRDADGKPVFTDEATFRELREANGGVPPYAQKGQPQKPPPAGTVVVHHKNLCFGWWFMAVKKVESGEVDPAALVPMDKEAFEALLAADKAKGATGK